MSAEPPVAQEVAPLAAVSPLERRPPSIVVGVGGSAGSIEATSTLIAALPASFTGAVIIVVHMAPTHRSALAAILGRVAQLPVVAPVESTPLVAGSVYVASPGLHLLVRDGTVTPSAGPRENGHRPAVDPMFRTLAHWYGERAVGVVVSGARDDGTAGLHTLKQHGGTAFAQDPNEAQFDGMPASAARYVAVDAVLPLAGIAARLVELAAAEPPHPPQPTGTHVTTPNAQLAPEPGDDATRFTCPDCGGVMYHHVDGAVEQYRCSVGHLYSPESYTAEHARAVETALWEGARILSDRAAMMADMEARAKRLGQDLAARRYAERRAEAERHADALRALVEWIAADVRTVETAT